MFCFFAVLCFLEPHPRHVEVPRLGVELELQLLAYTTATACGIRATPVTYTTAHGKGRILQRLSEARNQTRIPTDTSWVRARHRLGHNGNS